MQKDLEYRIINKLDSEFEASLGYMTPWLLMEKKICVTELRYVLPVMMI